MIASAIEKPSGVAGAHQIPCADCGTKTVGRFCHNCGNPSHVHRTLLHLGEELLHGVMHFDSRAWRTLPLLVFRPGKLTRAWVMGKRARYVSPLALFLFTIFVMFMALSYAPAPKQAVLERRDFTAAEIAKLRTDVAKARAALEGVGPEQRPLLYKAVEAAEQRVKAAETGRTTALSSPGSGDWKTRLAEGVRSGEFTIGTGNKALDEKLRQKAENPEFAIYKLQQTFYKFSFLLVPISIPFVALLFVWKRGVTLYDHGVFVLYSLTFMSALIMAGAVSDRLGLQTGWLVLAPPAHMFFQLRGAYGLGWFSALWRTVLLQLFCVIALGLFILAVVWLGLT
ncbi:DUF3667 domain-containing protein [Phenylobacterium sp.]|uniref:DUF3667 domain-containing protein n=1 Tax=Phenylobacterium sp. TaxID=1871053 RepID=UPI0037CC01A0